jgi:hypothetical protein
MLGVPDIFGAPDILGTPDRFCTLEFRFTQALDVSEILILLILTVYIQLDKGTQN